MTYPTGKQLDLTLGDQEATVTELGAGLRRYAVGGRDVVAGYDAEAPVKGGRGQQLLPWPNRIRDGRYSFGGVAQQLVLSEPKRNNASHGLVRYVPWMLVEHAATSVAQRVRVYPQPGWAGTLEAMLTHRLTEDGLDGGTFEAAGPEPLTAPRIAELIGERLGRDVVADDVIPAGEQPSAYAARCRRAMLDHQRAHGFVGSPRVLTALLGRPPRTFAEHLAGLSLPAED